MCNYNLVTEISCNIYICNTVKVKLLDENVNQNLTVTHV